MVLANYNIEFYLYELDKQTDKLSNVASEARINGFRLGGRALVVGPVVSDFRSDLFANNENGANRFFTATDTGVFAADSAKARDIADVYQTGDQTLSRTHSLTHTHTVSVGNTIVIICVMPCRSCW